MTLLADPVFDDLTTKLNGSDGDPTNRVVILVDMDCFYCQVEEKLQPHLAGKPLAVVQYNEWKGGGIIAVNYPARAKGVSRHMRGDEAKKKCPEITLARVPCVRGKADLTKYREAGKEVAEVLKTFTPLLERASVDEAYLDVTEVVEKRIFHLVKPVSLESLKNTFVVGCSTEDFLQNLQENEDLNLPDLKLAVGAVIAELLRAEVYKKTGYRCSAGVAHNKILAKQACGINKPNKQTILPHGAIESYYASLPVHKITGLGGKFGVELGEKLGIKFLGELRGFSEKELAQKFDEKTANWLYNIARGIDLEPVTTRLVSKSIGCCKKFPGKSALLTEEDVKHWLFELSEELAERLEQDLSENNRKARQVVVSFAQEVAKKDVSSSRTTVLNSYEAKKIFEDAFEVVKKFCLKADGGFCLKFLGLSAGHFEDMKNVREITSFFKVAEKHEVDKTNDFAEAGPSTSNAKQVEMEDEDSISSELFSSNETVHEEEKDTSSFFVNYLNSIQKENKSPVQRDFNTSKILEEDTRSDSSSSEIVDQKSENTDENGRITCEECGKKILTTEITSHNDYHFAIKIVKSEVDLYKPKPPDIKSNPAKSKISKKRKQPQETITKFLQNQTNCEEINDGELCNDCNKKIRLEEIESHRDYHIAKKLHAEINNTPKKSSVVEKTLKNAVGKSRNKKLTKATGNGKIRPVTSFFKPV